MLAQSEAAQIRLHAGVEGPKNIPPVNSFKPTTLDYGKAAERLENVVKRLQPLTLGKRGLTADFGAWLVH